MNPDDFEERMRALEYFHGLRVLPGTWPVLRLDGRSFQHGINFNDVPAWQKRGTGVYWESYEKEGFNPKLGQPVAVTRRRLKIDRDLPLAEDYAAFIARFLG